MLSKVRLKVPNFFSIAILFVFVSSFLLYSPGYSQGATSTQMKVIASGTKYATELYVIRSGVPGPVVMIVGGVHGNEPAGYNAAEKLTDISITEGTLLILPHANQRAVNAHTRYIKGEYDLNRAFPKSKSENADNVLAREIFKVVKDYNVDWLMDMHEGYDYSVSKSNGSVGQTLIYYPDTQTKTVGKNIVSSLNNEIAGSNKDFRMLTSPVSGSLASASARVLGVNSFIFETCSKVSLSTRVAYQLKAANILLSYLNMK